MNELIQTDLPEELKQTMLEATFDIMKNESTDCAHISIKGGKFKMDDEFLGTVLDAVVLETAHDLAYYDRPYDPEVLTPPACFHVSLNGKEKAPHELSPVKQADVCAECYNYQFGSANGGMGKGKACREYRRLLLAGLNSEGCVMFDEIAIVKVPPTSMKAWSAYSKTLASRTGRPFWSVVTEMSFDEASEYVKMKFKASNTELQIKDIEEIARRRAEWQELVTRPYDVSDYEAPEEPVRTKKSKIS